MPSCDHLLSVKEVKTGKDHCEACVKTGDTWVHLRVCQECGVTLCCDSSPNQHASGHFNKDGHPVISSAEPGEKWLWCYEDKRIKKY
jgi:hypothetical protein